MAKSKKTRLRDRLDKIFSNYIRLKYAQNGYVACCSCGKVFHWKKIHAGHWIIRKYLNTRWDEFNVHPQCCGCNTYGEGNSAGYAKFMLETYGEEIMDRLIEKRNDHRTWRESDYQKLIDIYKDKLKSVEKNG